MNWGILAGIIGGAVLGVALPGIGSALGIGVAGAGGAEGGAIGSLIGASMGEAGGSAVGAGLGGALGGAVAGGSGSAQAATAASSLFGPRLSFGQRAGLGALGGGIGAFGEILGEKEKGAQARRLKQTSSFSPEVHRQLQAATGPAPSRAELLNRVKGLMGQAGSPQLALSRSVTSFGRGGV